MTDRGLASVDSLNELRFDERGLLPVVAQDAEGGRVLMVAWANREALARTRETGELHFWSRSRGALWRKGETSGHVMRVTSLHADCDGDVVLALVHPMGPACHTGEESCFGDGTKPSAMGGPGIEGDALTALWALLESRAREQPANSYTTRLLGDENLRIKKLGEESAELVLALSRQDVSRIREEAADLIYHLMVALLASGVTLEEVKDELRSRQR
jgi:phosphoribosyl-ATP pyrophosphohydrolase/phosphoribosyl-AMP cyclohydrolase